eukprot:gene22434-biopygen8758
MERGRGSCSHVVTVSKCITSTIFYCTSPGRPARKREKPREERGTERARKWGRAGEEAGEARGSEGRSERGEGVGAWKGDDGEGGEKERGRDDHHNHTPMTMAAHLPSVARRAPSHRIASVGPVVASELEGEGRTAKNRQRPACTNLFVKLQLAVCVQHTAIVTPNQTQPTGCTAPGLPGGVGRKDRRRVKDRRGVFVPDAAPLRPRR